MKYAKIRVRLAGGIRRAVLIRVDRETDLDIRGYVCRPDGDRVERRIGSGYSVEYVVIGKADIIELTEMRMDNHYAELVPA